MVFSENLVMRSAAAGICARQVLDGPFLISIDVKSSHDASNLSQLFLNPRSGPTRNSLT